VYFDAVFIDADNTLFDFDRTQDKALHESLGFFGLPVHEMVIARYQEINLHYWGLYNDGEIRNDQINELRWRHWLDEVGQSEKVAADTLAEYYAQSLSEQCELEDGAQELISYLTNKLPVHVITNGFPSSQKHRWRKAGWENKLHGITVSAVVGVQKPAAEIFNLAMAAVGVTDPSRCLMIGDSLEADVKGPQDIGMKACWYQRKGAENKSEIQPDFIAAHLNDIHDIV